MSIWFRNLELARAEDSYLLSNHENPIAGATASEGPEMVEEKLDTLPDTGPSTSSVSVKWNQETQDAPESNFMSLFSLVNLYYMLCILLVMVGKVDVSYILHIRLWLLLVATSPCLPGNQHDR